MFSSTTRSILRMAPALALAAGVGVGSGVAHAATNLPDAAQDGKASLTIHKFQTPAVGLAPGTTFDGRQITPKDAQGNDLTPLAGAGFTATLIKSVGGKSLDLLTNTGWDNAESLTVTAAQGATDVQAFPERFTSAAGTASFANLPLGVYLVHESTLPPGASVGTADFLVTVPLTDQGTKSSWLYDVHVYPKNDVVTATKTVKDQPAYSVGAPVKYTITGDIPAGANGGAVDYYQVLDPIPVQVTYDGNPIVQIKDGGTTIDLVDGVDFTSSYQTTDILGVDAATYPKTADITFTATGLAKLTAHRAGQVVVTLNTVVNDKVLAGNDGGKVENVAIIVPADPTAGGTATGNPGDPDGPGVPTTPVETYFGSVTLAKTDMATSAKALDGAVFRVYSSEADAKSNSNPISVNGQTDFTTGAGANAAGQVTIDGLHRSDWIDGTHKTAAADYQHYWIAEVKAPAGYELLAEPIQVDVLSQDTTVDYTVKDALSNNGWNLPFTGSAISASFFYGGGAAILAGVVVMLVAARRRAELEQA